MASWLNTQVRELFLFKKLHHHSAVGVEIEIEGAGITSVPYDPSIWKAMADGSLRGESIEFVTSSPLVPKSATTAVEQLYAAIAKAGATVNDSMRAGVHVHINCQEMTLQQMFTFMAAYYCLEDLISQDLGEDREGNLFCLRLSDAEDIAFGLVNCCKKQSLKSNHFTSETYRYAALNLVSISKFGSLEFRSLKTPDNAKAIITWIELLVTLKKNSQKFGNPRELLAAMSANGDKEVVKALLGPVFSAKILAKPNYEKTIYNSIRLIQFWAYTNTWGAPNEID